MALNAADSTESTPDLPQGSGVLVPSGAAPVESVAGPTPASRALRVALGLLPLGLLLVVAMVDFPLCPFRVLTGVDCPGCGLTRATDAMFHLRFGEMLRIHPLAPVFAPLVLALFGRAALSAFGVKLPKSPIRVPDAVWLSLMVMLLGLWLARLAGLFGGPPDPTDVSSGVLGHIWAWVS